MGFGSGFDNGANVSERMNRRYPDKPKKTVFAGDMVIHVWAQRTQSWGRNSKATCYFEGDTLYSYGTHYVAARFVADKRGKPVALFNGRKSSLTTDGQVWAAKRAVKDSIPQFTVSRLDAYTVDHAANYAAYVKSFHGHLERSKNTRVKAANRVAAVDCARSVFETLKAYRAHFLEAKKYPLPKFPADIEKRRLDDDAKAALNEFEAFSKRRYTRSRGASVGHVGSIIQAQFKAYMNLRRLVRKGADVKLPAFDAAKALKVYSAARKASKRLHKIVGLGGYHWGWIAHERQALNEVDKRNNFAKAAISSAKYAMANMRYSFSLDNALHDMELVPSHCEANGLPIPADYADTLAQLYSALDTVTAQEKKQKEAEKLALADKVALWQKNEIASLPYDAPTLLRVSKDGKRVETSKGATFPLCDAKKVWPLIKTVYEKGAAFESKSTKPIHVGMFTLDGIRPDGSVIAGCHTILRGEVLRFAVELGLQ